MLFPDHKYWHLFMEGQIGQKEHLLISINDFLKLLHDFLILINDYLISINDFLILYKYGTWVSAISIFIAL